MSPERHTCPAHAAYGLAVALAFTLGVTAGVAAGVAVMASQAAPVAAREPMPADFRTRFSIMERHHNLNLKRQLLLLKKFVPADEWDDVP
jgi:hypothetical protein